MTPIFPNSATVSTRERFVLKQGRWHKIKLKVRYGLLVHPQYGPVLIDTGYGPEVTTGPKRSLALKIYATLFNPRLLPAGAPKAALASLGYAPHDVTRIIVTHFHADHVSALAQFPNARFVAQGSVFAKIMARKPLQNLHRGIFPELLPNDFAERLINLQSLAPIKTPLGLGHDMLGDASMISIDLPGHAEGHFGVYFPETALLYAVDTQWLAQAITEHRLPGFPAARIAEDAAALATSAEKVAQFMAEGGKVLTCHDPASSPFDHLVGP